MNAALKLEVRLAVFDFDGVLAISTNGNPFNLAGEFPIPDPQLEIALKKIQGHNFASTDWISELAGVGIDASNRRLLCDISDFIFMASKESFMLYPRIEQVIPELSKRVTLAILSNNCRQTVYYCLQGLARHFACIKTFEDLERLKPHPEGLMAISGELGIHPANILLIGNSADDVAAAESAGAQIAIANWGDSLDPCDIKELGRSGVIQLSDPYSLLSIIPNRDKSI